MGYRVSCSPCDPAAFQCCCQGTRYHLNAVGIPRTLQPRPWLASATRMPFLNHLHPLRYICLTNLILRVIYCRSPCEYLVQMYNQLSSCPNCAWRNHYKTLINGQDAEPIDATIRFSPHDTIHTLPSSAQLLKGRLHGVIYPLRS